MSAPPQLELFAPTPGVAAEPERPPEPPAPAPVGRGAPGARGPTAAPTSAWAPAPGRSPDGPAWCTRARRAPSSWPARVFPPTRGTRLFRTVGVDRTFYGPVNADTFRAWAAAVPDDFRFLVKAHEALTLSRFPPP